MIAQTSLTPAEALGRARELVQQLWTMHAAAARKVHDANFILDVFGAGGREAAESTLNDTARQITWLGGEGLVVLEKAAQGVSQYADPVESWNRWRDAAVAVGDTLQRLQGFAGKWGAGVVLSNIALNVGVQANTAAKTAGDVGASSLPLVLLAVVAIAVLLVVFSLRPPVPA